MEPGCSNYANDINMETEKVCNERNDIWRPQSDDDIERNYFEDESRLLKYCSFHDKFTETNYAAETQDSSNAGSSLGVMCGLSTPMSSFNLPGCSKAGDERNTTIKNMISRRCIAEPRSEDVDMLDMEMDFMPNLLNSNVEKKKFHPKRYKASQDEYSYVQDVYVNKEMKKWVKKFHSWSQSEQMEAMDTLIKSCNKDQIRHTMQTAEPLLQRDFISLLPKELALAVLGYLETKDLLKAAQTCRYWSFLASDHLLWKAQCRRIGVTKLKKIPRSLPEDISPWKAAYMRHYLIENNWLHKPLKQAKVMRGHDEHVITCLQFSGKRILSGSDDTTLKVWSAVTGRCLRTLAGHTGGVWSSQMSRNLVISGSTDRTLRIWNAKTGRCLKILTGHTSTVRCMHLFEKKVVSGSRDATLRVWSVPDGRCLRVLVGHLAAVRCVQYDGKVVVSGAYDYFVKVWNPVSGECLHTLAGHTNRVYSLQFDGVNVVSGSLDTSIRVWDVETGRLKHTLTDHQSLTSDMEIHSNILVSGNADSTVKVWDITTGNCLHTLSGPSKHQSAVTSLQSNSKYVITSSDDGTVKLWDLRTGQFIRNLVELSTGGAGGVVWRVRASPTKLVCAVGSRNDTEETKLLVLDFDIPRSCSHCKE